MGRLTLNVLLSFAQFEREVTSERIRDRARLVNAIARGRRWLDEIVSGSATDIEQIATRQKCSVRQVNMTISLAFLAPDLVKAAVEAASASSGSVIRRPNGADNLRRSDSIRNNCRANQSPLNYRVAKRGITAASAAGFRAPTRPPGTEFLDAENVRKRMRLSTLVQAVLANSVRTPSAMLKATTCDELSPLALSADATSGVASIDFRSDCISSSLVCATMSSTFERTSGFRSLTSTTCMLSMTVLD